MQHAAPRSVTAVGAAARRQGRWHRRASPLWWRCGDTAAAGPAEASRRCPGPGRTRPPPLRPFGYRAETFGAGAWMRGGLGLVSAAEGTGEFGGEGGGRPLGCVSRCSRKSSLKPARASGPVVVRRFLSPPNSPNPSLFFSLYRKIIT